MQLEQTQLPATSTSPATDNSLAAYTPAQIEAAKAAWMRKYQLQTRPVGGGFKLDRWVAIALISGVSLPITGIGIAFILANATPNAAAERVIVSQMNMIEAQNQELSKPRKICVLAYCPPEPATSTAATPAPEAPQVPTMPVEGQRHMFNVNGQWVTAEWKNGQWVRVVEAQGY